MNRNESRNRQLNLGLVATGLVLVTAHPALCVDEEQTKNPQPDQSQAVLGVVLPAHQEPAAPPEPREEPLHRPAAAVATQPAPVPRLGPRPVLPVRGDHLDAPLPQLRVQRVAVVRLVPDRVRRLPTSGPPPFAQTKLASMKPSDSLIAPRSRSSEVTSPSTASSTPIRRLGGPPLSSEVSHHNGILQQKGSPAMKIRLPTAG